MSPLGAQLARALALYAAARMRRRYPDWSQAMLAEHASIDGEGDKLLWALGSVRASFSLGDVVYAFALLLSVLTMALYQWSADESLTTLVILTLLSLVMGCLKPQWFVVSGVAIGAVVAAVNGFETLSGVRPAYEAYSHSAAHDLKWLALLIPAVASSAAGRLIHLKLAARLK